MATTIRKRETVRDPLDCELKEAAEYWSRRIGMHIAKGEFHVAKRLIDRAESELNESNRDRSQDELLDMPLAESTLGVAIINTLERGGLLTVRDALQCSPEELLAVPHLGNQSLEKVLRELERLGFSPSEKNNRHATKRNGKPLTRKRRRVAYGKG